MSFNTIQEIQDKFLIRVFGDTSEDILLKVFNNLLDESTVVSLLYNNDHLRPYDVLNLARYYKYILNDHDNYMKYVMKAKELGCMDAYSVITWNLITQNKLREAIEYIETDVIHLHMLPITTIENMIHCGTLLEDNDVINKYTSLLKFFK